MNQSRQLRVNSDGHTVTFQLDKQTRVINTLSHPNDKHPLRDARATQPQQSHTAYRVLVSHGMYVCMYVCT